MRFNNFCWNKVSKKIWFIVSAAFVLGFIVALGVQNANSRQLVGSTTFTDASYPEEVDKFKLDWLIYFMLDDRFEAKLFADPAGTAKKLGLGPKQTLALQKIIANDKTKLKEHLDGIMSVLGLCDRWPCPPVD
ncbi:hypothetical protein L0244_21100 [bacterium]|nr:hypothetical protein [bacterium]